MLYLLVGILGGFAQGYVYPKVYATGDAAATAANLVQHAGLVRLAVVADLAQATIWIFLGLVLFSLLHRAGRYVATTMVVLVAVGAGITMLNAVFEFEAVRAATGAVDLASFGTINSSTLLLMLVDTHHYGLLIAQVFFGLWLVPLGLLTYRSRRFPRALSLLLVVGGACYVVDSLLGFLVPEFGSSVHGAIVIPCAVAEVWTVGYLLLQLARRPGTSPAPDRGSGS